MPPSTSNLSGLLGSAVSEGMVDITLMHYLRTYSDRLIL